MSLSSLSSSSNQAYRESYLQINGINQINQKIKIICEKIFKENQETPELIDKKYKIELLQFLDEKNLVTIFLQSLGLPSEHPDTINTIAQNENLKGLIVNQFIPALNHFQSNIKNPHLKKDLDELMQIMYRLNECLNKNMRSPNELFNLYGEIRICKYLILNSLFHNIRNDFNKHLFAIQNEILKLLHENSHTGEALDEENWNKKLSEIYNTSKFEPRIDQTGPVPVVSVKLLNLKNQPVNICFHALPPQKTYFTNFIDKKNTNARRQLKSADLADQKKFKLKHDEKRCNCMSFAVGRASPTILTPNGRGSTPETLAQFHRELMENGCINIESIVLNDMQALTGLKGENNLIYLNAFVYHGSGSGSDFHVYRCFFDQEKGPIWMELSRANGGVQFSKIPKTEDLILGIPENPESVFCKPPWTTFAGYWLIPPEANFKVEVQPKARDIKNIMEETTFIRFVPENQKSRSQTPIEEEKKNHSSST